VHVRLGAEQIMHKIGADETGPPGDEDITH
jgi:hypothetical protein